MEASLFSSQKIIVIARTDAALLMAVLWIKSKGNDEVAIHLSVLEALIC